MWSSKQENVCFSFPFLFLTQTSIRRKTCLHGFTLSYRSTHVGSVCMCVRQVIVLFVLKVLCLTSDFSVVHSSGDRYISAHILAPGWETKQGTVQSFGPFVWSFGEMVFPKSSYLCRFLPLIVHHSDVFLRKTSRQTPVRSKSKYNLHWKSLTPETNARFAVTSVVLYWLWLWLYHTVKAYQHWHEAFSPLFSTKSVGYVLLETVSVPLQHSALRRSYCAVKLTFHLESKLEKWRPIHYYESHWAHTPEKASTDFVTLLQFWCHRAMEVNLACWRLALIPAEPFIYVIHVITSHWQPLQTLSYFTKERSPASVSCEFRVTFVRSPWFRTTTQSNVQSDSMQLLMSATKLVKCPCGRWILRFTSVNLSQLQFQQNPARDQYLIDNIIIQIPHFKPTAF